ncbi:MAG: hypothetical protein CGW95_04880 [Phenylobacterium zucineum]|nr:MAG: hypothetical protein CGW95_04880 [Phenylobacterium zucineum]
MKQKIAAVLASISFAASAGVVCEGPDQCEKMWFSAQKALTMLSTMRIRFQSESRIETFRPSGYGRVGGSVTKEPLGEGKYRIAFEPECYTNAECENLRPRALKLFDDFISPLPKAPKTEEPS